MYKILIVYSQSYVNKYEVYYKIKGQPPWKNKTVLQRAGWALPRPFLYINLFFLIKK